MGELYNEIPDRVSDAAVLVGLGYAAGGHPALGWAAALLAVMTAYIRSTGKNAGAAQCFVGPMAKQHRMWIVVVAALVAAAWPATLHLGGHGVVDAALGLIVVGSTLTCVRRLRLITQALKTPADGGSAS